MADVRGSVEGDRSATTSDLLPASVFRVGSRHVDVETSTVQINGFPCPGGSCRVQIWVEATGGEERFLVEGRGTVATNGELVFQPGGVGVTMTSTNSAGIQAATQYLSRKVIHGAINLRERVFEAEVTAHRGRHKIAASLRGRIINASPHLTVQIPSRVACAGEHTSVQMTARATDPEGGPVDLVWRWGSGVAVGDRVDAQFLQGRHRVVVEASDGTALSIAWRQLNIVDETAPRWVGRDCYAVPPLSSLDVESTRAVARALSNLVVDACDGPVRAETVVQSGSAEMHATDRAGNLLRKRVKLVRAESADCGPLDLE